VADSFSTFNQVRLIATGAYNNTWGATLNSDAINLLDPAICGWTVVNIASATSYSLPALTAGTASVSRFFSLLMTGTPGSAVTVTVPSSIPGKMYLINNQTGQTLTFTYSGSTSTTTVANGEIRLIWCDGTNCWPVVANASSATSLGGTPAANWVRQSRTAAEIAANTIVQNSVTIPTAWPYQTVTEGPTTTIDANAGNSQILTLTGNRTMAAPINPRDGSEIDLLVVQDGTGGRTLTWNSIFLFANGLAPTLGTAAGAIDRFLLRYNFALNRWTAIQGPNLNSGAGTTLPITISSNSVDWNLKAIIGTLGSPATINILVAAGVVVESSSSGTPAMDLSGLISGCTINLTNLGYILGTGGRGGRGGGTGFPGSGVTYISALAGQPGGQAIKGPGSGSTFNITNGNGHIWGGGGGGGGGGVSNGQAVLGVANAGGGGAGSGGAFGGEPGLVGDPQVGAAVATAGGDSTSGVNGTFGAAGVQAVSGSGAHAQNGGAGGDWGAAGTAGANDTTFTYQMPGGAAGAAGKAIELSGGSATFISGSGSPNVKGVVS
jgi:hypothetical protein